MPEKLLDDLSNDRMRKYQNEFYKLMVEYLGEEIFVADANGKILFVNPASAKTIGLPVDQIVGKTAQDLEDEHYFSRSCTLEVLKQRKQVNLLQKLKDGRTVLATGVPIYDNSREEILMVITTSKDVDEVNRLLSRVENQEKELQKKNEQIEKLQDDIFTEEGFIYGDAFMKTIRDAVIRIAPLEVTVLVEGETGVGKEVIVRTLHRFSKRKDKSFVKINCGIIPENLIEAELFGYEAGAFTGAQRDGKKGMVEIADGGTLFLDEIGEMPLNMQVKLLDFIQDGTFQRVGGTKKIKVDTRIIAATNRDLRQMSDDGYFRQDLFFRLNVIPLHVPPLRERCGDIEALSNYFVMKLNKKYNTHKRLDFDTITTLKQYGWPGNVREMEHCIERAHILTDGDLIKEDTIHMILKNTSSQEQNRVSCNELIPLKEAKQEVEKLLIQRAYDMYGNTYRVAEALQIDQSTVVKLLKKHKTEKKS